MNKVLEYILSEFHEEFAGRFDFSEYTFKLSDAIECASINATEKKFIYSPRFYETDAIGRTNLIYFGLMIENHYTDFSDKYDSMKWNIATHLKITNMMLNGDYGKVSFLHDSLFDVDMIIEESTTVEEIYQFVVDKYDGVDDFLGVYTDEQQESD